ncbi:GAF domain-containing protein [Arthrobacter sp. K5]|uniref:GAF domain-containing protein n=1 Tax=Arthrobacter sp. K5 TaxID=2839623 RepID=A0AAU8EMM7_9MICC
MKLVLKSMPELSLRSELPPVEDWTQRNQILAALTRLDLRAGDLWPAYFGQGGNCSEVEIDAYLNGALSLPAMDQDLLACAVNDVSEAAGGPALVPSSWDSATPVTPGLPGHPAADLGAAGRFLLPPEGAEAERLSALLKTGLLDSSPEQRFDRIVRDVRKFFSVSITAVSLIADDRQFTKSIVGAAAHDVPRDVAFCNETVRTNALLVVPDARADGRFSANPFVLGEPHIRFYAGFPLHGRLGWNIGALDVIDQKPRDFSTQDQRKLRGFARRIQQEIDA